MTISNTEMRRRGEAACAATIEEFVHFSKHGKPLRKYEPNVLYQPDSDNSKRLDNTSTDAKRKQK
jgi:hypothetical protein